MIEILLASNGPATVKLMAVTLEGKDKWAADLRPVSIAHAGSMRVARTRPWAAVGLRDGLVYVVEVERGEIVSRVKLPIERPDVAWMEPKPGDDPLLVIGGDGELNAYRLNQAASKPAEIMIGP